MCSTCNHTTYNRITEPPVKPNDKPKEYLEQELGFGSLVIRCDVDGKNYRLAVKGEHNSEFKMYRCPTCGKEVWKRSYTFQAGGAT